MATSLLSRRPSQIVSRIDLGSRYLALLLVCDFSRLLGLDAGLLGFISGLLHLLGFISPRFAGLLHRVALLLGSFASQLLVLVVALLSSLFLRFSLLFHLGALRLVGVGRLLL